MAETTFPLSQLLSQFEQRPDAPALITGRHSFSARTLLERACMVADGIQIFQQDEKGKNSVLLPSSDPGGFVVGLLACELTGCTAVPWMDAKLPREAIASLACPAMVLTRDGESLAIRSLDGPRLPQPPRGDLIMTTSGSTGTPKGVALEMAALQLNALTTGAAIGVQRCAAWAIDLDFALMSAVCHLLMAWRFGLPLIHLGNMAPMETRFALKDAFGFGGSPLQLLRLTERFPEGVTPAIVVSSGDFLTPEMIDTIRTRYPRCEVHKLYGMTELAGRFCHMPHDKLMQKKAAAGYPLPGYHARIHQPDSSNYGQIEAKTPLLMHGYYHSGGRFEPQEEQWLQTGDFGTIDADGAVTLVGRSDDVLKVGGEKVDRFTVEAALSDLFKGADYCVIPVTHHLLGRCLALFVTQPPSESLPTRAAIIECLRRNLPNRFIPPLAYTMPGALPRLANGKLDRQFLAKEHAQFQRLV